MRVYVRLHMTLLLPPTKEEVIVFARVLFFADLFFVLDRVPWFNIKMAALSFFFQKTIS